MEQHWSFKTQHWVGEEDQSPGFRPLYQCPVWQLWGSQPFWLFTFSCGRCPPTAPDATCPDPTPREESGNLTIQGLLNKATNQNAAPLRPLQPPNMKEVKRISSSNSADWLSSYPRPTSSSLIVGWSQEKMLQSSPTPRQPAAFWFSHTFLTQRASVQFCPPVHRTSPISPSRAFRSSHPLIYTLPHRPLSGPSESPAFWPCGQIFFYVLHNLSSLLSPPAYTPKTTCQSNLCCFQGLDGVGAPQGCHTLSCPMAMLSRLSYGLEYPFLPMKISFIHQESIWMLQRPPRILERITLIRIPSSTEHLIYSIMTDCSSTGLKNPRGQSYRRPLLTLTHFAHSGHLGSA